MTPVEVVPILPARAVAAAGPGPATVTIAATAMGEARHDARGTSGRARRSVRVA